MCTSSLLHPWSGTITFAGARLDSLSGDRIIAQGVVQVPEGRRLFPEMTVEENLVMGSLAPEPRAKRAGTLASIYEMFPRLCERRHQLAGTLSGGEQQMCAIGRGLMGLPKLLMLDEPSLGLAPIMVEEMFKIIRWINNEGTTVLLVEQNVRQSLGLCDRAYVLENGRIVLSGAGTELLHDKHVQEAYLGL
jgi:branched-chain amino acid transport system ATP-binding protein